MSEKFCEDIQDTINKLADTIDELCEGHQNQIIVSALLTVLTRVLASAIPEKVLDPNVTSETELHTFLESVASKLEDATVECMCMCSKYKNHEQN